jgi:anti-sigma factor RsiW
MSPIRRGESNDTRVTSVSLRSRDRSSFRLERPPNLMIRSRCRRKHIEFVRTDDAGRSHPPQCLTYNIREHVMPNRRDMNSEAGPPIHARSLTKEKWTSTAAWALVAIGMIRTDHGSENAAGPSHLVALGLGPIGRDRPRSKAKPRRSRSGNVEEQVELTAEERQVTVAPCKLLFSCELLISPCNDDLV